MIWKFCIGISKLLISLFHKIWKIHYLEIWMFQKSQKKIKWRTHKLVLLTTPRQKYGKITLTIINPIYGAWAAWCTKWPASSPPLEQMTWKVFIEKSVEEFLKKSHKDIHKTYKMWSASACNKTLLSGHLVTRFWKCRGLHKDTNNIMKFHKMILKILPDSNQRWSILLKSQKI